MKMSWKWIAGSLVLAICLNAKAETSVTGSPDTDTAVKADATEAPATVSKALAPQPKVQATAQSTVNNTQNNTVVTGTSNAAIAPAPAPSNPTPSVTPAVTPPAPAPTLAPAPVPVAPTTTTTTTNNVLQANPTPVTADTKTNATPVTEPTTDQSTRMHFGFLAGLSSGEVTTGIPGTSISAPSNSRLGVAGGLFFNLPLNHFFSIQPQLLYIQKGGDLTAANPFPGIPTTLRYDVVELPLLAMGKFGSDFIKGTVFAGPSIAIAVNQSLVFSQTGQNTGLNPQYRNVDVGIHMGAGTEMAITQNLTWNFNVRYIAGLANIDNGPATTTNLNTWLFLTGLGLAF